MTAARRARDASFYLCGVLQVAGQGRVERVGCPPPSGKVPYDQPIWLQGFRSDCLARGRADSGLDADAPARSRVQVAAGNRIASRRPRPARGDRTGRRRLGIARKAGEARRAPCVWGGDCGWNGRRPRHLVGACRRRDRMAGAVGLRDRPAHRAWLRGGRRVHGDLRGPAREGDPVPLERCLRPPRHRPRVRLARRV